MFATLAGAGAIVLWASETVLVTLTGDLPPLQIVALAFAAAALPSPLVWRITGQDPRAAFRQPVRVWLFTVPSLLGYHAALYYAVQKAPAASAALLQGCTPLLIVAGSTLLPGERPRWWHLAGTMAGLTGALTLVGGGGGDSVAPGTDDAVYLAIVGGAAALWGVYSLLTRTLPEVPSSAMGAFYAVTAVAAGICHFMFEDWMTPNSTEWTAILALGLLPTGLALYLWDHGIKHGDLQALGSASYAEPLIGAVLVGLLGRGEFGWPLLWAGTLIVGGAALGSRGIWSKEARVGVARQQSTWTTGEHSIPRRFTDVVAAHESQLAAAIADAGAGGCALDVCDRWMALLGAGVRQSGPEKSGIAAYDACRPYPAVDDMELRRAYAAALGFTMQLAARRYWWRPNRIFGIASSLSASLLTELHALSHGAEKDCECPETQENCTKHDSMSIKGGFSYATHDLSVAYEHYRDRLDLLRATAEQACQIYAEITEQLNHAALKRRAAHQGTTRGWQANDAATVAALVRSITCKSREIAATSKEEIARVQASTDHLLGLTDGLVNDVRQVAAAARGCGPCG